MDGPDAVATNQGEDASSASGSVQNSVAGQGDSLGARTEEKAEAKKRNSKTSSQKRAHVFISTDEKDLRPIFVVINSTLANAK